MYKLTGVTKQYQKGHHTVAALQGVDLVIDDGEWLAIQGPTGHRKPTLLQLLCGLHRAPAGRAELRAPQLCRTTRQATSAGTPGRSSSGCSRSCGASTN